MITIKEYVSCNRLISFGKNLYLDPTFTKTSGYPLTAKQFLYSNYQDDETGVFSEIILLYLKVYDITKFYDLYYPIRGNFAYLYAGLLNSWILKTSSKGNKSI